MQKIQLCLASPSFFPAYGGAELRFMRYLPGLRERGIDTRVVTGTPKAKKLTESDRKQDWYQWAPGKELAVEYINGTPVQRTRLPDETGWRRTIIFNRSMLRICKQPDSKPDVVQLLSPLPPRSIPWLIRIRSLGIPMLFAYTLANHESSNQLKRKLQRWALQGLYGQMDCIVANSKRLKDLIRDRGVRTRIEVIPNGVNLDQFRPAFDTEERLSLRNHLGIGADQIMITTVGSIRPRKGIEFLLESWIELASKFPNAHLVLVGARSDRQDPKLAAYRLRLEKLISASGAAERVHFTGLVTNIEEYLRASDLFVFPSEREGMPNAVLEAMACGLPVVMTPFIGLPEEFGTPGKEYLLVDRNAQAITNVISQLITSKEIRDRMGREASCWVQKTMDIQTSLDQFAALYKELAGRYHQRG